MKPLQVLNEKKSNGFSVSTKNYFKYADKEMGPLQNISGKIKISLKLSCQNKG